MVSVKKRQRVFRHQVVIELYTEIGRNELNQPIRDWVPFATVWAEIDPLRGREYWASRQVVNEQIVRISFRHIKGIKPDMRVRWGDRVFEIESVMNPVEQNYEIQLLCKEKVS